MSLSKRECRVRLFDKAMGQIQKYMLAEKGPRRPDTTVKTTIKGWNIYVNVKQYGQSLSLAFFQDGRVKIDIVRSFGDSRGSIDYYMYDEQDDHEEVLRHFRKEMNACMKWYLSPDKHVDVMEMLPTPYKGL